MPMKYAMASGTTWPSRPDAEPGSALAVASDASLSFRRHVIGEIDGAR